MKIAFHDTHLGIRGTSVAMYDYANYNEILLKDQHGLPNSSIIVVPENSSQNDSLGVERFKSRFQVFTYKDLNDLENILEREKCDMLYCIKYGHNDNVFSRRIKTVIHCVFDMSQPHGDVYAGVSQAVAEKYNKTLFVPHMISLGNEACGNLREQLGIPSNSIVFGRYGGMDTFDLPFCRRAIVDIVNSFENIYFLFSNTPEFYKHQQIKYVSKMVDEKEKLKFIQTCDAYIECGSMGHSFGLAIGEFSVVNKPIIAYKGIAQGNGIWNDAHIKILKEDGIYFTNEIEFFHILTTFIPYKARNCYTDYSPEKAMSIFEKVFIN